MKPETPGYLKEIEDAGWIQEIIMERFDNALELMAPTSIIYGGAIRDCIAGKELLGDLDFAVTADDFGGMSEAFQTNSKWIPTISQSSGDEEVAQPVLKIKSSGDLAKNLAPMSGVSSFTTMGGKIVQLITSKYQDRDPLQSAIYVARMVDIVCCGMIMLCDGRVFEAVPGAYQDCLDGVLHLNKTSDTIYLDALGPRVEKLVNRGWKNTIDVAKVIKEIEDSREKARRKEQRLAELRSKRSEASPLEGLKEYHFMFGGYEDKPILGGYMQEITKDMVDMYFTGHPAECLKMLELFASRESINMRVKQTPIGSIYFETANGEQAYRVQRRLQMHYEKHGRGKVSFKASMKKEGLATFTMPVAAPPPSSGTWGSATLSSGEYSVSGGHRTYTISTGSSSGSSTGKINW